MKNKYNPQDRLYKQNAKLTEQDIENLAIENLEKIGYQHLYGPSITPNSKNPERKTLKEVILADRLQNAINKINPKVPEDARKDAIKDILRLDSTDLVSGNETFHSMLTRGINVIYQKEGESRGDIVWPIDFNNPENNDFLAVNQFTVIENSINKRLDIVLFINGIPIIVMELKNAADENASVKTAFEQILTYKHTIPHLFIYNGFIIISDGLEAKAGTISAEFGRFMNWKTVDGKKEASHLVGQIETIIRGMLDKKRLVDLIKHFIVFEKSRHQDLKNDLTFIKTQKKLAAYHQYFAVNKAVESTICAALENGTKKGGVVWHTQGSGKSLSMVFYTGKIVSCLDNPTVLVITDRNDLDDQLFDTFAGSAQVLRQEPVQAQNRKHLKELLKVASGGVVFSTIQKFQPDEGNVYEMLSDRKNIVVIADEAHRTQYGFKANTIDDKDKDGKVIGKKTVYGFAKYMRDALPNATFLGFTGTPIEKADKNTPAVFGDYIDVYDIADAVEDKATVPIYYEGRLARISLSKEGKKLIEELDGQIIEDDLTSSQKVRTKWTRLESLVGSSYRIKKVAADIISHFELRREVFEGKAMIAVMSRRIAAELYSEIIKIRQDWHSDDFKKGVIKTVITASSSDCPKIAKHHTTKEQRRVIADRMKAYDDELKLVIVCDMWLTGFDVPCLHTLYIDKPMRGHNLMQAIARVNRVYKDKPAGLIVDYLGIASDLKKALSFYADSGGKGDPASLQEKAVDIMLEQLETVSQMFFEKPVKQYSQEYKSMIREQQYPYLGKDRGMVYEKYFTADTPEKLKIILAAQEHILSLDNGKKRFIEHTAALSRAFAIAIPHQKALDIKEEVAFFQAVKARLSKFDTSGPGKTDEETETIIKQVINKAIVTEKVIDIFDAAGITKPDISILSEEFLLEVKNMKHKNIALEVLKKLLKDEIRSRMKKNMVISENLMTMLEKSINRYHNRILTAAQVIEELIELSRQIRDMDKEPQDMGLSEFEYAFYTAVAQNENAIEIMQKEKLRELAVVLFEKVKEKASIDWTIKENVRAKLKVAVKRTLREYGYPPKMQEDAVETVLKQAELIAKELTEK